MSAVYEVILCPSCRAVSDRQLWKPPCSDLVTRGVCPNCGNEIIFADLHYEGYIEQVEFF